MRPPHGDAVVAGAEPLTSVALVCQTANPRVAATRALVWLIDAFVAVDSRWTTASACAANVPGLLRLLPRVAALEPLGMDPLYKRKLLADAVDSVAQSGDLAVLQWLVDVYVPTGRLRGVDEVAARHGHLHVLKWLLQHRSERVVRNGTATQLLRRAAKGNHLETCRWLFDHDNKSSVIDSSSLKYLLGCAVRYGNVEMAVWLHSLEPEAVELLLPRAIKSGHLGMVQWATALFKGEVSAETSMALAVAGGHLQLAQWLHLTCPHASARSLLKAAANGHFNMVMWALECSIVDDSDTLSSAIDFAAAHGRLDIVRLLHTTTRGRCSTAAMDGAAQSGHLELVEWLHYNRDEGCSTLAMDGAAKHGHLQVVKWLHTHRSEGCTPAAMDGAAQNNHLDLVKWLHSDRSEGCTVKAMDLAAASGHLETVKWIHDNRSEGCTTRAMDSAAANGHLAVVRWLHTHRSEGCTANSMDQAALSNHLDVIQWLDLHRSEGWSDSALCEATALGHLAVVQWLVTHRSEPAPSERAVMLAVERGHFEVLLALDAAGKFECPIQSISSALQWRNFEIFQWLVREHSGQFQTGLLEAIGASDKAFAHDCLEELEGLEGLAKLQA